MNNSQPSFKKLLSLNLFGIGAHTVLQGKTVEFDIVRTINNELLVSRRHNNNGTNISWKITETTFRSKLVEMPANSALIDTHAHHGTDLLFSFAIMAKSLQICLRRDDLYVRILARDDVAKKIMDVMDVLYAI